MARQETVTLVCDSCGGEEGVRTRRLGVGRTAHYVEACDACWAPVAALHQAGRSKRTPPLVAV